MPTDFVTLPDELQSLANHLLIELAKHGYRSKVEPKLLQLPATPTIMGVRGHETHYFLVRELVSIAEIQHWQRYCCCCATDTRVTICRPHGLQITAALNASLRELGIGLATCVQDQLQYGSEAGDLAFHARAPDRALLKPKVRGSSLARRSIAWSVGIGGRHSRRRVAYWRKNAALISSKV